MKIPLFFMLLSTSLAFSQVENPDRSKSLGLGYGLMHDFWTDDPGHMLQLDVAYSINNNSSFSGRAAGLWAHNKSEVGSGYSVIEKKSGINIEIDYNYHFYFWRLDLFPSAGVSTRYTSGQRLDEYRTTQVGDEIVDFSVKYYYQKGLGLGYTAGLNLQTQIDESSFVGLRVAGMLFFDADRGGYRFVGLTLRRTLK